jgi:hypothetical protein
MGAKESVINENACQICCQTDCTPFHCHLEDMQLKTERFSIIEWDKGGSKLNPIMNFELDDTMCHHGISNFQKSCNISTDNEVTRVTIFVCSIYTVSVNVGHDLV